MNKPLEVDDASPCMKCGSVQCAFCSDDVLFAIKGLKKDIKKWDNEKIQGINEQKNKLDAKSIIYFIDKWFPVFKSDKNEIANDSKENHSI